MVNYKKSLEKQIKQQSSLTLKIGTEKELKARELHILGDKIKRSTDNDPFGDYAVYSLYR